MFQLQRTCQLVQSHEQTGSNFRTLSIPVQWYYYYFKPWVNSHNSSILPWAEAVHKSIVQTPDERQHMYRALDFLTAKGG